MSLICPRHKSAIRFSQAWEEAIQRYGALVRFGRVHAQRERDLARTMPAKFNVIPAVVVYANGRFATSSKTFLESSRHSLPKLARFIADSFPNSIESVTHSTAEIRSFMRRTAASKDTADQATMLFFPDFAKQAEQARKQQQPQQSRGGSQQQRFQQQMLQTNTQSINEPSLSMKSIARKYQYSFLFGQVQQIAEPNQWKNWIKDVSQTFKRQWTVIRALRVCGDGWERLWCNRVEGGGTVIPTFVCSLCPLLYSDSSGASACDSVPGERRLESEVVLDGQRSADEGESDAPHGRAAPSHGAVVQLALVRAPLHGLVVQSAGGVRARTRVPAAQDRRPRVQQLCLWRARHAQAAGVQERQHPVRKGGCGAPHRHGAAV